MTRKNTMIKSMLMVFVLILVCVTYAGAADVGRFTQVEGQVDLLKEGNLPAVAVKLGDPVGPKDVIRTKSLSRAQITFIDDSTLTLSPESRIAIEEFQFDEAGQKRNAVLNIFQGLALAVVNKVIKAEEPDFVVKTHTAIVGVRGTEFGMRLSPNSSTILNFKGSTQVGNILPEVGQVSSKDSEKTLSFGWNNGSSRWVFLKDMQGTKVDRNMRPTKPFTITRDDQMQFMRQLATHAGSRGNLLQYLPKTAPGSSMPRSVTTPGSITTPGTPSTLDVLTTVTVPPTVTPPPQTPPPPPSVSSPPSAPPPPPTVAPPAVSPPAGSVSSPPSAPSPPTGVRVAP